jgi:hypothetical protein
MRTLPHSNTERERVTVNIPVDVHRQLRRTAGCLLGETIVSLIVTAWEQYRPKIEKRIREAENV